MRTEEATITPEVMRWARERSFFTHERIAKKVSRTVSPELVAAWEAGKQKPTMAQAKKVAEALYVPFGYLFLPAPPKDSLPISDFRSIGNGPVLTGKLVDLINSVIFRHEWYREFIISEGESAHPFVGRFSLDRDHPETVAADIRRTLGITHTLRAECKTAAEFLYQIVVRCEAAGILVMRNCYVNGNRNRRVSVEVERFRGFAISDKMAPLVFINSSDFKAAQLFTIGHELAHIWIGETGISNEDVDSLAPSTNSREAFCDSVSAELLVPRSAVTDTWTNSLSPFLNVERIRILFKVSGLVAIRRSFDVGLISQDVYRELYGAEIAKLTLARSAPKKKQKGGGSIKTLMARNSSMLTRSIVGAAHYGRLTYRDAGAMLNLRPGTVERLFGRL